MQESNIIGIDLGGTNVRVASISDLKIKKINSRKINSQGSVEDVLKEIYSIIDTVIDSHSKAIGIGLPGLVDEDKGIVYDVINIPSWKEVSVRSLFEEKYQIPVRIQNDANCFALGEFYFGKGRGYNSMIGLTVGTGIGGGIILNKKLYAGSSGGAGEFGMMPYLDKYFEYYASGQFFRNIHDVSGEEVFQQAKEGNNNALSLYAELGNHLGKVFQAILYSYDPELIVVGGSLKNAWSYYSDRIWESL